MSIILNKKYVNNCNKNFDYEVFNQDYILCNNHPIIYDSVNKYCLKKSNISNILSNLIDFESKKKPVFNFDIIDKINYNKLEYQKLILKWMSYIENNIDRNISFYPENIKFHGGCVLNNSYNKIWSILSFLLKDYNKDNLIICHDYDTNNIINFFSLNNIEINIINDEKTVFKSYNLVTFSFFKKKSINFLTNKNWNSIFISDIHNFEYHNICFKSKFKWCSSTPYNVLNNKNFFKILNFISNNNLSQINYNILTYVIQVLFIYTEDNINYNKNKNFNILKKEIIFELNSFERKFYKNLINNNINFDKIKLFTSYPKNNEIFDKLKYDSKLKIINKDKCIICYSNSNNCKLDCGHEFCFNCLSKQLLINPSCPLCRKKITLENITIKKNKLDCAKTNFLKFFIENNRKKKILIVTQYKSTENYIKQILFDNKSNFILVNKNLKKQSNYNVFVLNYNNIYFMRELKNINYVLFFEPLYFCNYLRDKIESEIIGKINLDSKNNLKLITLGFKNTIDEKFLI